MYHVILVDDELPSLSFMQNIITSYFSEFHIDGTFESGLAALEYCRKNLVDLVITDIRMPIMDGIELARYVSQLHRGIHIVIVSGYADFEYAKSAIDVGVESYLLKPLGLSDTKNVLLKISESLKEEYAQNRQELLSQLITGKRVQLSPPKLE